MAFTTVNSLSTTPCQHPLQEGDASIKGPRPAETSVDIDERRALTERVADGFQNQEDISLTDMSVNDKNHVVAQESATPAGGT